MGIPGLATKNRYRGATHLLSRPPPETQALTPSIRGKCVMMIVPGSTFIPTALGYSPLPPTDAITLASSECLKLHAYIFSDQGNTHPVALYIACTHHPYKPCEGNRKTP